MVRPLRAEVHRDGADLALARYEGLIGKTAMMIAPQVEVPLDDIKQILSIRVWRALSRYDSTKVKPKAGQTDAEARDRYVFMCVRDGVKSIARLKRHGSISLDEIRDGSLNGRATEVAKFDARYLSSGDDYDHVGDAPELPDSLSSLEAEIVVRLYRDYKQAEIARELNLGKTEMERAMKSIRAQLDSWRPDTSDEDIETLMLNA